MGHRISATAAVLGALALSACGGSGGGQASAGSDRPLAAAGMDIIEIAQRAYGNGPRTPAGFYAEPSRDADLNYTIFHLRNTRVDPAAAADPASAEFELCANSDPEATAWELTDRQINSPGAQLLASAQTDAFYEYQRDVPGVTNRRELVRVFKCGFLDRTGVNLRSTDGNAGRTGLQPATADHVRFLAEYLWSFSFYNNAGNAVIQSRSGNATDRLTHELTQAEIQRGPAADGCDTLAVFTAGYSLNPGNGELTYREDTLWQERVRRDAGRVAVCD